jgi:hypothetical protein
MDGRLRVRRARRDDLPRVRALLGETAPPAPAERKRWRRLVSTLREDLYLAECDGEPALLGLAVIVYVRGLGPTTAIVRRLVGGPDAAAALLARARDRARARGCPRLEVQLAGGDVDAVLAGTGWSEGPRTRVCSLPS